MAHAPWVQRRLAKLLRAESGAVAIVVAVGLGALLAIAALVIDMGIAWVAKFQLQGIADAAALAGTRRLGQIYESRRPLTAAGQAGVRAVVPELVAKNRTTLKASNVAVSQLLIGRWNRSSGTFQPDAVTPDALATRIEAVAPTFLAAVIGVREVRVSAASTAALTPLGEVSAGDLTAPIGLASAWLARGPLDGRSLRLFPPSQADPCVGWTTYTETPSTVGQLQAILSGLASSRYTAPAAVAGRTTFQFVGGNPAPIASALKALYDAKKDSRSGQWITLVPVYHHAQCRDPSGSRQVAGFATVSVSVRTTSSGDVYDAVLHSGQVQPGRGGGPDYGTKASIPVLVR